MLCHVARFKLVTKRNKCGNTKSRAERHLTSKAGATHGIVALNAMISRRLLANFFQWIVWATRYSCDDLDYLRLLNRHRIHSFALRIEVTGQLLEHACSEIQIATFPGLDADSNQCVNRINAES